MVARSRPPLPAMDPWLIGESPPPSSPIGLSDLPFPPQNDRSWAVSMGAIARSVAPRLLSYEGVSRIASFPLEGSMPNHEFSTHPRRFATSLTITRAAGLEVSPVVPVTEALPAPREGYCLLLIHRLRYRQLYWFDRNSRDTGSRAQGPCRPPTRTPIMLCTRANRVLRFVPANEKARPLAKSGPE